MPDFSIEKSLNCNGLLFGLDEAGRGPWCGPVVAACVCFKDTLYDLTLTANLSLNKEVSDTLKTVEPELLYLLSELNDSKKLTAKKRDKLYPLIFQHAIVGVGQASAEEIDEVNILQASFLAMRRALDTVIEKGFKPAHAIIDGNRMPKGWSEPCSCIVKGDSKSLSIAAASIVAKVTRDRMMCLLAQEYPSYGWDRNAGYGTKDHIAALYVQGVTIHHRKSYAPIKKLLESAA